MPITAAHCMRSPVRRSILLPFPARTTTPTSTVPGSPARAQDGTLVITTTTTYRQEAELYARNLYYVDPETGALLYAESTSYSLPLGESVPQADYGMDTNEVMAVQKTTITYDTPISFDLLPHEQILASTDYAEAHLLPERYRLHDLRRRGADQRRVRRGADLDRGSGDLLCNRISGKPEARKRVA